MHSASETLRGSFPDVDQFSSSTTEHSYTDLNVAVLQAAALSIPLGIFLRCQNERCDQNSANPALRIKVNSAESKKGLPLIANGYTSMIVSKIVPPSGFFLIDTEHCLDEVKKGERNCVCGITTLQSEHNFQSEWQNVRELFRRIPSRPEKVMLNSFFPWEFGITGRRRWRLL